LIKLREYNKMMNEKREQERLNEQNTKEDIVKLRMD
jgi:hypothetical protein